MIGPGIGFSFPGALPSLPLGARIMLTSFLMIVGSGYLVAVANIYQRHSMADGVEGMSLDDIRAVYSGLTVPAERRSEMPSRMLTMIRGEMRQYFSADENFTVLESWLKAGATKEGLDQGEKRRTPNRVIVGDCLRCHAKSTGTQISKDSPFGADEFDVDYALISKFTSADVKTTSEEARVPPQYSMARLVLVSHMHMLSIPLFTLIVGGLFAVTRLPGWLRGLLTPLPMLALVFDFAGWWLARFADVFVYAIAGAGAVFGVVFGLQIMAVVWDLWRAARPKPLGVGRSDRI